MGWGRKHPTNLSHVRWWWRAKRPVKGRWRLVHVTNQPLLIYHPSTVIVLPLLTLTYIYICSVLLHYYRYLYTPHSDLAYLSTYLSIVSAHGHDSESAVEEQHAVKPHHFHPDRKPSTAGTTTGAVTGARLVCHHPHHPHHHHHPPPP